MLVSPDEHNLFTLLLLCEIGKHVPTVAMTCWCSLPIPWEYCLAPPLPGFLFLAHTCCPSVGCDFRVSFEHSTLSPLNLILKLSCLVFKSLAKNILLGLCDKLPILCQGPVIPALRSMVQNSHSQVS